MFTGFNSYIKNYLHLSMYDYQALLCMKPQRMPINFASIGRIVSGGQTGADRAAMDFAIRHGFDLGGFVPRGRMAEDGPIDKGYAGLTETASSDPAVRTELNVINSDATIVFSHDSLHGGSLQTVEFARRYRKPILHVLLAEGRSGSLARAAAWLQSVQPNILNIAGPRASEDADIYEAVSGFLEELFSK
jgi:hypothetical protein